MHLISELRKLDAAFLLSAIVKENPSL